MKLTAIGNNVVLKLNDRKTTSSAGIALPSQWSRPEAEGTITSLGSKVEDLKEGDVVGLPEHLGTRFTEGPEEFLVIGAEKLLYVRQ